MSQTKINTQQREKNECNHAIQCEEYYKREKGIFQHHSLNLSLYLENPHF